MKPEETNDQQPKILVVDDNEKNIFALEKLLNGLDAEIFTAQSGNEALSLLLRHEFALVLLDVQMPGMDGYETATLMRGNQAFSTIPIIFVTATSKAQQNVFEGYEAGAVDYLFKPIDPDILISKTRVFLELDIKKQKLRSALAERDLINKRLLEEIQEREKMERKLLQYSDDLEEIVKERTARLRQKNDALEQEISERKQIEAVLQQTAEELKEKTRRLEISNQELKDATVQLVQSEKLSALGELTAGVAHELNQPLNGIKIIAQSLLRDIQKDRLDVDELDQELAEVVFQVDKMSEIIDHMRIYSRRTAGSTREMIDVNSIIDGANKFLYQQLTNHNIKVVKQLESDLPQVLGDPIRLEQVAMNLITNSKKAVDSSGNGNKTIEIKTYQDNGRHVIFEVSDNGVGIPPDKLELIFEPFFTTRAKGEGTGLGLSISNKIIEEHNGRIEVASKPGEETTFRVFLPLAQG